MMQSRSELQAVAAALVAPGKGILAADESNKTMTKRLEGVGAQSTPETRGRFRELLCTTPGVDEWISGVILYDETLRQSASDGTPFPTMVSDRGVIPGIKVDTGTVALPGPSNESITEGLDGLRDRLTEYRRMGARFAKWRAVISMTDGRPTEHALEVNAHSLAMYAALCQEADIVPVVEPEVLMDGTHGIDRSEEVTEATLDRVFSALRRCGVVLEEMVLKPNMVVAGYDCQAQPDVDEVADRTLAVLRRVVPAAVPGIAFLSGGQSDERAAAHLDAINRREPQPWQLTFSYGRALVMAALTTWGGNPANVASAQSVFAHRARCNAQARCGRYSPELETAVAA
jgi:fructose-bisphosphate aldolase class I